MISGSHYLLTDWVLFSQVALHHCMMLLMCSSCLPLLQKISNETAEKKNRLHSKHIGVKQIQFIGSLDRKGSLITPGFCVKCLRCQRASSLGLRKLQRDRYISKLCLQKCTYVLVRTQSPSQISGQASGLIRLNKCIWSSAHKAPRPFFKHANMVHVRAAAKQREERGLPSPQGPPSSPKPHTQVLMSFYPAYFF